MNESVSPGGLPPALLLQRFLGLILLLLGSALLWVYPVASNGLLFLALILVVAQWRYRYAWLVALPVLLACVDLGAWSGWLLLDECDGLLAVLAGTALAAGHYAGSAALSRRGMFWLWLWALVLAIGLQRGLFPLPPLDANAWFGYLTQWNAIRIFRGGFWALLFAPLLLSQLTQDRQTAESRLAMGLTLAMIGFGAYVLWQRGLLIDLMTAKDRWGLFATWLNLSGKYRITGTFSQMHFGGEAVDAFLILVWPFAFWLLLNARRWSMAAVAGLALALAAYSIMVTITRTTYLAAGLAFLVYVFLLFNRPVRSSRGWILASGGVVVLCAFLTWFGFRYGGSVLLASFVVGLVGCFVAGFFRERLPKLSLPVGVASLLAIGLALAVRAMLSSRWADTGWGMALAIAVPSILIIGLGGLAVGRWLSAHLATREALTSLAIVTILLPIGVVALSGYQMQSRANTVSADWQTRMEHWQKTVSLMPGDLISQLFGRGLGVFPRANLVEGSSQEAGWFFLPQGMGQVVRIVGNSSLTVGQRLMSPVPGRYTFAAQVRNPSRTSASLEVRLEPRRVLEMGGESNIKVLTFSVKPSSAFTKVEKVIDIDPDAIPRWFDSRSLVFSVSNQGHPGSALDLADIQLNDAQGKNVLLNGNFAAGGVFWLAYSDFHHLDWHMKSLYVATFFESGFFGLAVLLILIAAAVWRGWEHSRQGRTFAAALVAAIAGFLVLGIAGTLSDVPRVMTLFLLLCTAALWRQPR
ncbi:MAG TPA: hypothetical protein PKA11_06615 [Accumulibacter sp.]|nr:hypothetical protein [Accumulibacter sp.]